MQTFVNFKVAALTIYSVASVSDENNEFLCKKCLF